MAVPPTDPNEAFIREVDDAVREDTLLNFWRRYGMLIAGAVIAGLLGFAGYLGWTAYQHGRAEKTSEAFAAVLEKVQRGEAASEAELSAVRETGATGYDASADLIAAAQAVKDNRVADAVRLYAAIAGDSKAPQAVRDLALVRQTAIEFDQMKPEQVVERLKPLAAPGNPWFGSAGEMVALAHVKMGNGDLAGTLFASIAKDETVPQSIRTRSVQMAGLLGVDAVTDQK